MKKNITIELLGDRIGVDTQVSSPELLVNSSFGSGVWNNAGYTDADNYATGWDLNFQTGSAQRQFEWNNSGWLQKTAYVTSSKFRQVMTLGAGVAYTLTMKFKDWTGSGTVGLVDHGMSPPGVAANIGANVLICDPSASPAYGLGVGAGSNPNLNVGFGGGCPPNAPGRKFGANAGQWAEHTVVWRQSSNYSTAALTFQMDGNSTITIDWIKLSRVDMNQSLIIGTLDGANPEDSPLSLNYAINSATNIESRAGSYSKTFQIPATSNNNEVLKRMNITNSTHNDSALRFQTPCRIAIGGVFAVEGLFKVQDVIRIKDKAVAYSCVFFGDNLGWTTLLENRMLNQIEFQNSTSLRVSAKNIIESWEADDGATKTSYDPAIGTIENTSPIVYPFASYGPTNETGIDGTMQLLREYWEAYYPAALPTKNGCYYYATDASGAIIDDNPLPVVDWKPMIWIYQMIHAIFKKIGYTISSSFIESSEFKRLLYATPNANHNNSDERFQSYSSFNDFNDPSVLLTIANLVFGVGNLTGLSASHTWPVFNNSAGSYYAQTGIEAGTGNGSSGDPWPGPPSTIIEDILVDANRFQTYVNNDTFVTHTGSYTYWTIGESGYYNLELENFSTAFTGGDLDGFGEFSYASLGVGAGIGIKVKSIGNTTWDTLVVEQNLSFQYQTFSGGVSSGSPIPPITYWVPRGLPKSEFEGYFNKGDQLKLFMAIGWRFRADAPAGAFTIASTTTFDDMDFLLVGTDIDSVTGGLTPTLAAFDSSGVFNITLLNPSRLEYGSTYDLANIIPPEHTQIDFIKGVAHCFNLQFQTNETTKTVYIEPFSEFYQAPNTAIDWTSKLDRSKEVVDSWIDSDFTRRLIFKYKTDDKDAMIKHNSSQFDGVEDNYPYIEYLNESYPVGDTVFENPFFSGTFDAQHFADLRSGGLNFYSAAMWETVNREAKGYEFAPRILLYTKKDFGSQNLAITDMDRLSVNNKRGWDGQWWANNAVGGYNLWYHAWLGWADVTDGFGSGAFPPAQIYNAFVSPPEYHAWGMGYNWMYANLPQCGVADRWEFTNSFALTYGNYNCQDYEFDGTIPPLGQPVYGPVGLGLGLYHRYYKTMIDNLIQQPKLRTAYIDLKVTDILGLDFSVPIYIDGIYYKLLKVVDYQPHFNASTEVELHQYNPETGAGIPQSAVWISPHSVAGGIFNINDSAPMPSGPLPY